MARLVKAAEATAARRRVYFHLVDATDGVTPENGEAGGQPQISTNGGAWADAGIGTLNLIGNGRYYADLTAAAVNAAGDAIETRYKSANTAECPGDSFQVVAFDPHDLWGGAQLTESYAADGTPPTPAQMLYMLYSSIMEFGISGTTMTFYKLNGTESWGRVTLDSATRPTRRTRSG